MGEEGSRMVLLGDVGDGDRDTVAPSSTPTVTRLPLPGLLPPPEGAGGTWILTRFSSKDVLGASTVVMVRLLSYCAMVARVSSTDGPTTRGPGADWPTTMGPDTDPLPRYGDTYPDSPPLLPPQPEETRQSTHIQHAPP